MRQYELVECLVFQRDPGEQHRRKGLGAHRFGRVPVPGEYIAFDEPGEKFFYLVKHVVHTAWGDHAAELYVERDDRTEAKWGDPNPPA